MLLKTIALVLFVSIIANAQKQAAIDYLKDYNARMPEINYPFLDSYNNYFRNITDENWRLVDQTYNDRFPIKTKMEKEALKIDLSDSSEEVKRQFNFILKSKTSSNLTYYDAVTGLLRQMNDIYYYGSVPYNKSIVKSIKVANGTTALYLSELKKIMEKSTDPSELLYAWKGWRDAVGPPLKTIYPKFVTSDMQHAQIIGFTDSMDARRSIYESGDMHHHADDIWQEVQPLYQELHAYVRYRLQEKYPTLVKDGEAIPAHLLGNMWAQEWQHILPLVKPYKDVAPLDATPAIKKNFDATKIFRQAEAFYTSLGFESLPKSFWKKSLLEKPADRTVDCSLSNWDMYVVRNGSKDVRQIMCTRKTQEDFVNAHFELGYIYYYLSYWNQTYLHRNAPHLAFFSTIGETIKLSVFTPDHFKEIGLLDGVTNSYEADVTALMYEALTEVAFLPYAYILEKWTDAVHKGKILPEDYNKVWWDMRLKYQGIKPPVERNDSLDFDPAAKQHITYDYSYLGYFSASVLQFTFHQKLCKLAGNTKSLHRCSIYKSKPAGEALRNLMSLGSSQKWEDILRNFTGSPNITADALQEYFAPLHTWLQNERKTKNYKLGWSKASVSTYNSSPICVSNLFSVTFVMVSMLILN